MTDKKDLKIAAGSCLVVKRDTLLKEGTTRGEIKGGVERNDSRPAVRPKSPPPAPKKKD